VGFRFVEKKVERVPMSFTHHTIPTRPVPPSQSRMFIEHASILFNVAQGKIVQLALVKQRPNIQHRP